jgi:hypothetical protein
MTEMVVRAATDPAPAPMIAGAIPLIDVAGHLAGDIESSRKAAAQLRWAFENVGFYYLAGHGVPRSLIDRTYEAAARFHAQEMAKKLALQVNEHNIGYLPIADPASPGLPRRAANRAGTRPISFGANAPPTIRRSSPIDAFTASINGPTICPVSARRRSNTCGGWRRYAAGWCRSTPWRSTCGPISSTHASPCRT